MTKTCVVCKKYPISGDNTRSFHKFPVNQEIKMQWMNLTGITKLTVNCTVCSDHFTPDSYHQTDGYTSVKRLIRNAVPNLIKTEPNTEEVSQESDEGDNNVEDCKTIIVRSIATSTSDIEGSNDYDDQNNSDSITDQDVNVLPQEVKTEPEDENEMNMSASLKRKLSTTKFSSELSIKRMFRFRDRDETKYICRDEFVSEEAWEKFLTLMLLNKRKMEALQQKIARSQMFFGFNPVSEPVNMEDFGPDKFLEVILKE